MEQLTLNEPAITEIGLIVALGDSVYWPHYLLTSNHIVFSYILEMKLILKKPK